MNPDKQLKEVLKALMLNTYNVEHLSGISPEQFQAYILSNLDKVDYEIEGYTKEELDRQRDLSIKFHWGHDQDFGSFKLEGKMQDRHINVMSDFMSAFDIAPDFFKDKSVFDVGCWTGGTTLLLAALGAQVYAIDEVKKYADMAAFLLKSFGKSDASCVNAKSVYDCNEAEYQDRFDVIYYPGVIYHVTDPVLSLRILFNACKIGGTIFVESFGCDSDKSICEFEGSDVNHSGTKEELSRTGWNWFVPSLIAMENMIYAAGFREIKSVYNKQTRRLYSVAKKTDNYGITKAGLSIRNIR